MDTYVEKIHPKLMYVIICKSFVIKTDLIQLLMTNLPGYVGSDVNRNVSGNLTPYKF